MMSRSTFVAVAGLVALTAVTGVTIKMEGASTLTNLINGPDFKAAVAPTIVASGGNGSGAGKAWVAAGNYNKQVMSFGDGNFEPNRYVPLPANVAEVPIAYGSQAIYVNLPGIPGSACLSSAAQCRLFNANARSSIKTWDTLLTGLPPNLGNLTVRIVVRSDSSGSTRTLRDYYKLLCARFGAFTFAVDTATTPPTVLPGYVGAVTTSGVLAQVIGTVGSVGYMGCGYARSAHLSELPLTNQLGRCTLCRNCMTPPTAANPLPGYDTSITCGNYASFRPSTPSTAGAQTGQPCDWTSVVVNGDKDNDGDIYGVDIDNDGDGIRLPDFPLVFAEYSYFNRINKTPACPVAKTILKKMISVAFQTIYPVYSFEPLPLYMRQIACSCISAMCPGVPSTGNGVLTAAGNCL